MGGQVESTLLDIDSVQKIILVMAESESLDAALKRIVGVLRIFTIFHPGIFTIIHPPLAFTFNFLPVSFLHGNHPRFVR